jgi:hypothetical protein
MPILAICPIVNLSEPKKIALGGIAKGRINTKQRATMHVPVFNNFIVPFLT